jgi:cell division protein FtsZ
MTPAPAEPEDDVETDTAANEDEGEELLLGADDVLTSPVGSPPIAPPADEEESGQATGTTGGTLFERMSNIARGAPKAQIEEDDTGYRREPIDIPRFLNRQNNQ